jgi:hypothetical protein
MDLEHKELAVSKALYGVIYTICREYWREHAFRLHGVSAFNQSVIV